MIYRTFRFRLAPTAEQETTLRQFAGVTRFVYNLALEQRRDFWRQYRAQTGWRLSAMTQGRQLTDLRREVDWIRAAPAVALHYALRDLDKAFINFASGRARFPSPRRKGGRDGFRLQGQSIALRSINRRWAAVRLPNLGWVKFRSTRAVAGRIVTVAINRDALGWHVGLACEIEHEAPANSNPAVGIDRGIAVSLALSNGETFQLPDLAALDRCRRRAQQALARCQRGSKRRAKRLRRVARLSAKIARVRADWQHRASRSIADRFGLVVFEDLKIPNMTAAGCGKRGLNRSILNQGWGSFALKLAYKLEERGGALARVPPAYSSQTCSACGVVDAASRKSQAAFVCVDCGFADNADTNAARIILRRSTPELAVEGSGYAPVEAATCRLAA